jgi:hypothetical protein
VPAGGWVRNEILLEVLQQVVVELEAAFEELGMRKRQMFGQAKMDRLRQRVLYRM